MRGKSRVSALVLSAVAVGIALIVTAIAADIEAGFVTWPLWATAAGGAVWALATTLGRKPIAALSSRLAEPIYRFQRQSAAQIAVFDHIRCVRDERNRITLNIHPAIPLPESADADLSDDLPEYVQRDIDADLRAWIRSRAGSGGMVVLVGDAAAGKSRCLYEALYAEVPDWRMLRLATGAQLNALVDEGVDMSHTVLWLDELQEFFTADPLAATSVRQLVSGRCGPVLLAGTIRSEELDALLASPAGHAPKDAASQDARQVVRMLARWSKHAGGGEAALRFHVSESFSAKELRRARALAAVDPRLESAVRDAVDGNVTATLAGAPELIERWTVGPGDRYGRAIITAAVVARRCGLPEPVTAGVLEALALEQVRADGAAPLSDDWLDAAIRWAKNPVTGNIAALRDVATTPGVVDGYRVSDILLQHSYEDEARFDRYLRDDRTWAIAIGQAHPTLHTDIALSAYAEGLVETAESIWLAAAEKNDVRAMRQLGWLYDQLGRRTKALSWLRRASRLGDAAAMLALSWRLEQAGEVSEAMHWTRQASELGHVNAMVNLGLALLRQGSVEDGLMWYRRAADLGSSTAMANLGYFYSERGDLAEAEKWNREGAMLGHPGAMENLAALLHGRGEVVEALEWYREAADHGMALVKSDPLRFRRWPGEAADDGVSNAVLGLAGLLAEQGEAAEAERWLHRIAELGEARAAARIAEFCEGREQDEAAERWRLKAAELADANLTRNKASLRISYGETAISYSVQIMRDFADRLATRGQTDAAAQWHRRADGHLR